jgi:hypothetical protein
MRKLLCLVGLHKKQGYKLNDYSESVTYYFQECLRCGMIRKATVGGHSMLEGRLVTDTKWYKSDVNIIEEINKTIDMFKEKGYKLLDNIDINKLKEERK